MILFGDVGHAKKIARAAGCGYDPDVNFCVSLAKEEQLLGGVIYTNYTGKSVQIHQAGFAPAWPTPQFMFCIYDFPFNVLKVEKLIATVPSTNRRAMSITRKMGFTPTVTIPDIVPGGDMEILSMMRHECKYLKLAWRYAAMENAA
jgi:hypothetical protein